MCDCPNSLILVHILKNNLFSNKQDSNVLSGNYLPSDQFLTNNINVANNNNKNLVRPVMETLPGFLPYADDSVSLSQIISLLVK